MRHQSGVRRQVVEQGGRLLEKQRQVVFDAGRCEAVADILVQLGFGRIPLEALAEVLTEAGDAALVEREFARRQEPHFAHRIDAALGIDVERPQRVDFIVEQVDAVGQRAAHREQVDQPAADRELARRKHLVHMGIAAQHHLRTEGGFVERVLLLEEKRVGRQKCGGGQPVQGRGQGHHGDVEFAARNLVQRCQPFGNQVRMGRKRIVGQGFPVGKGAHP
jgi:hypothetical protein